MPLHLVSSMAKLNLVVRSSLSSLPLVVLLCQLVLLFATSSTGESFLNPFEKFENRNNIFSNAGENRKARSHEPRSPLDTPLFEFNGKSRETESSSNPSHDTVNINTVHVDKILSPFSARSVDDVTTDTNKTPSARADAPGRLPAGHNPSVDEIISGLIQLIGGNVKLNRPGSQPNTHGTNAVNGAGGQPMQLPPGLLPPQLVANPGLLAQFANRLPSRLPVPPFMKNTNGASHPAPNLIAPNLLIGPSRIGLPLHFPPKNARPAIPLNSLNRPNNPNGHPVPNHLPHLAGLASLPVNAANLASMFSSYTGGATSLPANLGDLMISAGNDLSSNNSRFVKVDESEVSRLLGLAAKPSLPVQPTRAPSVFANIQPDSSDINFATTETLQGSFYSAFEPNHIVPSTPILESTSIPQASTKSTPILLADYSSPIITSSTSQDMSSSWQPFNQNGDGSPQSISASINTLAPAPDIITRPEEPSIFDITVKHSLGAESSTPSMITPTQVISATTPSSSNSKSFNVKSSDLAEATVASTISANSQPKPVLRPRPPSEPDVVYGRPAIKPSASNEYPFNQLNSSFAGSSEIAASSATPTVTGRPLVIPVQMEQVRPQMGTNGPSSNLNPTPPQLITQPGQGSVFIDGTQKHFKLKPALPSPSASGENRLAPNMQVGSSVNVLPARDSSVRGSGDFLLTPNLVSTSTTQTPINVNRTFASARRPQFRPRPATPLVRIDTCIVGDDSTCGGAANEHCRTEQGISSCHCRPGYARASPRTPCVPSNGLAVSLRLDKLSGERVSFSKQLLEVDSEQFQYLEFETAHTLHTLLSNSRLGRQFLALRVNKFYPQAGRTMVNATIQLQRGRDATGSTIHALRKQLQAELARLIATRPADLTLTLDATALPRVEDVNECADATLNDCSRNARCTNEPGGFSCACKAGFEDRAAGTKNARAGRVCTGCSFAYCTNRGECIIVNGERTCKCRGNYMGSRCDLDAEVLAVAFGGSLAALIIIIITFLCLYIWNQKWKNEQQKMEAMSSGSGQTFSQYVNKTAVVGNFRLGMEERMRGWGSTYEPAGTLQNNASNYNYYVNPEQILASSQMHVYATPSRVQTPDHLLVEEQQQQSQQPQFFNTRGRKSRNCNLPTTYQGLSFPAPSVYNETEFSAREAMYAPSHLILPNRSKYAMY